MPYNEMLLRIIVAAILGGLVGIEREYNGCGAGLRTHILVCIGSTLFMITSIMVGVIYGAAGNTDPSRIAAGVVTGIGFLGAGAIMRYGSSVRGLTTAASIWAISAIGLAVGIGLFKAAVVTTLVSLAVLVLSHIERLFKLKQTEKKLIVKIDTEGRTDVEDISRMVAEYDGNVRRVIADRNEIGKKAKLVFELELEKIYHKKIAVRIDGMDGVDEVYWK